MPRAVWQRLQTAPVALRWPTKWALFAAVVLLTAYPRPDLLVRQIGQLRRLNDLPNPHEPALQPVRGRFSAFLDARGVNRTEPRRMLAAVNAFVQREIPYSWDWDNWAVADYTPTLAELLARGTEDCDGRAVLAAALLRSEGIPAELVCDLRHVWVSTPHGDTMDPLGPPLIRSNGGGLPLKSWLRLIDPAPPAFGIAVFPIGRELIVLTAMWLLLLPAHPRRTHAMGGLVMLVAALVLIRWAGSNPMQPNLQGIYLGMGCLVAGMLLSGRPATRDGEAGQLRLPVESLPTGLFANEEAA